MEIIVCIKQVPDTTEVKIDPATNTLIRQGVPSIVNPYDKYALEAALQLKAKHGGQVTVISMGPPQAQEALKECIAMGADRAVLLSDRSFGGADTLATSYTLAAGIRKLGRFDLILCGKQAIDGDTAQVGPELAEQLEIPLISHVAKIDLEGEQVTVEREQEESYAVINAALPLVVTVTKAAYKPRLPNMKGIMRAKRTEIPIYTMADLDVDEQKLGLKGSPTQVRHIFAPKQRVQGQMIHADSPQQAAAKLVEKLMESKII
ncbi:electron transfer flavoprotein subunit beta [Heliobacillus mobilis]|uniref:Electron transfer flavoprotein small subunit n=1 Tax=Heliobacterium mobile TaxID=28064 RepID=A0A6I3SP18_HELMO|nr:electron transfer flavoprotein subunit beta/FixA family protein [Heliobacterium mobile]MTV49987.1 electron transfer flavoprotein subunit beta [Heliobacterium mobile]